MFATALVAAAGAAAAAAEWPRLLENGATRREAGVRVETASAAALVAAAEARWGRGALVYGERGFALRAASTKPVARASTWWVGGEGGARARGCVRGCVWVCVCLARARARRGFPGYEIVSRGLALQNAGGSSRRASTSTGRSARRATRGPSRRSTASTGSRRSPRRYVHIYIYFVYILYITCPYSKYIHVHA